MIFLTGFRRWLAELLMPRVPQLSAGREEPTSVEEVARDLVERSREGDQNALALICEVRDQYKRNPNNEKLKASREAIIRYIQANPAVSNLQEQIEAGKLDRFALKMQKAWFSGDVDTVKAQLPILASKSIPKAVVAVANGPNLHKQYLEVVAGTMTPEEVAAFKLGIKHGLHEMEQVPMELRASFILGHIIGTARKIQLCRCPGVPSSVLSRQVGVEFGC